VRGDLDLIDLVASWRRVLALESRTATGAGLGKTLHDVIDVLGVDELAMVARMARLGSLLAGMVERKDGLVVVALRRPGVIRRRRPMRIRGVLRQLSLERLDALTQSGVLFFQGFEFLDALAQLGVLSFECVESFEESLEGGGILSHRPHTREECFDLVSLSNPRADVKGGLNAYHAGAATQRGSRREVHPIRVELRGLPA